MSENNKATTPGEETKAALEAAQETAAEEVKETPAEAVQPQETKIDESAKAIPKEKKSKKKLMIILCAAAAVVIAVVLILVFTLGAQNAGDTGEDDEIIHSISDNIGNFYSGVVEPQQTADIDKDADRSIDQVYVKVGDTVKQGDKLFSYNTGELESKIATAKIELEGIQNDITENNNKISLYQRQRSQAETEAEKLQFTANIQDEENTKSQNELQLKLKQSEIDTMQKSLENSVVTAPISGIIKQINSGSSDASGAYMTILMNGAFRIKGTVDENNVRSLTTDTDVIVHSRNVEGKQWSGTITKVDTEKPADNQNNNYFDNQNSDSSAKYYFYVTLDSTEDMLLGEHVYIEILQNDIADDVYPDDTDEEAAAPTDDAAGDAA
ncbi:MAG: efflux RND transporter periplasmic adaptor subunit [Ruminococcus sp.]|nr:efflux RND transporter periplasmic adaptor subunit [Ruminococcus sp.]